jgi:organic hydroperoxide reductase OsmC/OhrA
VNKEHQYNLWVDWTGNKGEGTKTYRSYDRSHIVSVSGKAMVECSSDPSFLGDKTKYNPEELLVASLSACHMLWFLHLCAEAGVIVTAYSDNAKGKMVETEDGGGRFTEVILYPTVTVLDEWMVEKTAALHDKAHHLCFIANSVNFPVLHQPAKTIVSNEAGSAL